MSLLTPLMTASFAAKRPSENHSRAARRSADEYFWINRNSVISTGSDVFWKGDKKI
jgi:hypothetical protein